MRAVSRPPRVVGVVARAVSCTIDESRPITLETSTRRDGCARQTTTTTDDDDDDDMSRGAALARAALAPMDANARRDANDARATTTTTNGNGNGNANLKCRARAPIDAETEDDARRRRRRTSRESAREPPVETRDRDRASTSTTTTTNAETMKTWPRRFRRVYAACEATLEVARFMRARKQRATADAMCANVERSTGRRCTLETLRTVAACAPRGAVTFRARTSRAEDLKNVRVDVAFEDVEGVDARAVVNASAMRSGDKLGVVAMREMLRGIREKLTETLMRAHDGDAYSPGSAPPERWREGFDPERVSPPEPVEIEFLEEVVRAEPRLATSVSAPLLGAPDDGRGGLSEGELARAMSDLGPEGNGLSARAVQTVLERQVEVEAYNDPAAVADRERRRLYGGLPRLFDAIRSSFASSKRRVMELDALLDELTRTNARASVSAHELTDGVRILARTCPEWCTIAHAQHGDEELFRVVSRDPATARAARHRLAKLCRDAATH